MMQIYLKNYDRTPFEGRGGSGREESRCQHEEGRRLLAFALEHGCKHSLIHRYAGIARANSHFSDGTKLCHAQDDDPISCREPDDDTVSWSEPDDDAVSWSEPDDDPNAWREPGEDIRMNMFERMIVQDENGKPQFSGRPDIQFNLSHTAGLLACAVNDHPVGIDAERIRPYPKAVFHRLSEGEQAYILTASDADDAFMRVWTMKEAWVKLTGRGLADICTIECIPGKPLAGAQYRQFLWQRQYVVTAIEKEV